MRYLALSAALLVLTSGALRAGLYNTVEPATGPAVGEAGVKPLGFTQFRDVLNGLVQIGIEKPESPGRKHYLELRDSLQRKTRSDKLSIEESVNLSEVLIRLRQYEEAVDLLTRAVAQDRRNFMALANLATAHQLAGRLDRALSYLQQALDVWPKEWPGLSPAQLAWYREAEGYHLKLLRLRYREAAAQRPGGSKQSVELDALFGDSKGPVHFVGEQGNYEAGKLAPAEQAKLPADCLAITQQLLIWLPEDTRLYWLLGELYNAKGDTDAAGKIFEDCVWSRRFDAAELREHRKVVQAAPPKSEPVLSTDLFQQPASAPGKSHDSSSQGSWLPGTGQIAAVAAIAAVVIIGLVYFQIREFRKRKTS